VMTVVAVVLFPVVLLYQGWSLWTFRKRITGGPGGARTERVSSEPGSPSDPSVEAAQDPTGTAPSS
jgi:cytochrome bd ubiquinol oxidase subunit II